VRPIDQQVVLVTGSTDGLGRSVARGLAARGASVLVHGRDEERTRSTVAQVREATGNGSVHGYAADLSALANVRRLAEEVERDHERLDVLVNNAGIGGGREGRREESEDGYELRFAVNYLATFLLTSLLLPLLRRSAPARVVNVASIGQVAIDFEDVMLERSYEPFDAYRQSKLAQVMFTFELAERLGEDPGVTVNCLHPATLMNTKMVFESFGSAMSTIEEGAEATLDLVASAELDGVTGRYFDQLQEARAHEQAYDPVARGRLWALSEELTGVEAPAV
jgi:NAD(P)-dependent dehydrogenase (short-subunit alcohol dehydrogenase family)